MAQKVFLRDSDENIILPITRGELIIDSSGNPAFHSDKFLATDSKPGLMSKKDKEKLDNLDNTIIPVFTGATENNDGSMGLVPAPQAGDEDKVLKGDGTWGNITNTQSNSQLFIGAKDLASNAATLNGATYLKLFENYLLKNQYNIFGTGRTTVTSDEDGNIVITTPDTIDWSKIDNKPDTFTPSIHTHTSDQITFLTGYSKLTTAPSSLDLSVDDSLNTALGKLEYKTDIVYTWMFAEEDGGTIDRLTEIYKLLEGIDAGDNLVTDLLSKYLPLSGGTVHSAENGGALNVKRDHDSYGALISFSNNSGLLGKLGMAGDYTPRFTTKDGADYTLYHAGNFNPANYVSKSGDTMSGELTIQKVSHIIKAPYSTDINSLTNVIYVDAPYGWAVYGSPYFNAAILETNANGKPYYRNSGVNYELIHSGNIGSYTLTKSNSFWGQTPDGNGNVSGGLDGAVYMGYGNTYFFGDGVSGGLADSMTLYTYNSKPITFYTSGAERMRVASNGNVLIGTTSDNGHKLQVNGDEYVANGLRYFDYNGISGYFGPADSGWCHMQSSANFWFSTNVYINGGLFDYNGKYKIETNGNITAAHFYESSDKSLKDNIKSISNSENIPEIKQFDWKENGSHSYGLIAQELEELGYSELVDSTGEHKTVHYAAALSLIIGKIQNKIKHLESEIIELKKASNYGLS